MKHVGKVTEGKNLKYRKLTNLLVKNNFLYFKVILF